MKYEYILLGSSQAACRALIDQKRKELQALRGSEANETSDEAILREVLRELGEDGWEISQAGDIVLGKREKQTKPYGQSKGG